MSDRDRTQQEPEIPKQAERTLEREEKRGVPRSDHNLEENDGSTPAQGETTQRETYQDGSDR